MKVRAVAHRGYPAKYPENTLTAFRAAHRLGFTHVELDVQLSKDGVVVIMHDTTLNRTTNGTGWLKDYTYDELQELVIAENERIPTLKEALLELKDKMIVSVELKQKGNLYPGLEEKVWEVIQETGMVDQVYVNSFDHFSIEKMRSLTPDLALGLIISGSTPSVIPYMKKLDAKYLSVKVEFLTDEFVEMCEEAGIQIVTWPVNNETQYNIVRQYPSILSTTDELEFFKDMYEQTVQS